MTLTPSWSGSHLPLLRTSVYGTGIYIHPLETSNLQDQVRPFRGFLFAIPSANSSSAGRQLPVGACDNKGCQALPTMKFIRRC